MSNLPEPNTLDAALSIWRYHCLDEKISAETKPFDIIVGLGSYDTRVAVRCAELYQMGVSQKIVFTGKYGAWTKDIFEHTEAKTFSEIAVLNGVSVEDIVLDEEATNTGENIANVKKLFPDCKRAVFVAKPLMQRRCRATVEKIWPDLHAVVTAPNHTLVSQAIDHIDMQQVIHELVGTHWRVKNYAKLGFQTEQILDDDAEAAFQELVEKGYTENLPNNWQDNLEHS